MPVNFADPLSAQCAETRRSVKAQKRAENRIRKRRPLTRLWDGEYRLQHLMALEYEASFETIDNDTGTGMTVTPFDSPSSQWIHDMHGRIERGEKRNVHITVDYCGVRWGGRLDNATVEKRDDGVQVLVCTWLHDYEELKWYQVWSNPFLPAAVQFPRVFMLPGPARWALQTCLFLNVLRDQANLWSIPDDPMSGSGWGSLDQSDWPIVVKPLSFIQDMAAGTLWAVPVSRWKTWHDMAKDILQDAELSVVCRRYLDGDPDPWPGANLRHGALVVSIEDKSGTYVGTSHGGTIFDGLARTVAEFSDDLIDSTLNLVAGTDVPADYWLPGIKLTHKSLPYVVYREGATTGIQSSKFITSPSKGVQINTGGHSMPGVNEAISAGIQALGDIIGNALQIGSIGGSVDTLLKPFYEDTILAWMSVKSLSRSSTAGWSRYFEYFQDGADKAYTLSSLMVLRAGMWATKTTFSHELVIRDGAPFLIGEQGLGHFTIGDRVGATILGDTTGRIFMDRVTKLTLAWSRDAAPGWQIVIGDDKALEDPVVRAFGMIERIMSGLHDLGVF